MIRSAISHILLILLFLCAPAGIGAEPIRLDDLTFEGNDRISDGILRRAIRTRANPWYRSILFWTDSPTFDEKVFLNDLLRIEQLYRQEGFLQAIVTDHEIRYAEDGNRVSVGVRIREGKPTVVDKLTFVPAGADTLPFAAETLADLVRLDKGRRYREDALRNDHARLTDLFSNNGYPYIEALVKPEIDTTRHTVDLEWRLAPGPFSRFGEVRIEGNSSVDSSVILRGLAFTPGEAFSQKALDRSRGHLYGLELFQFVQLQGERLDSGRTEIPVTVNLRERKLNSTELGVGYGSEEALRLRANWTNRNFLGGARILRARAKHATKILPINLELEFSQPFFLDNQNDLTVKPFFLWEDESGFEARRMGVETVFNRQMTRQTNLFVTSRIERDRVQTRVSEDTLDVGGGPDSDSITRYGKSVLRVGARNNTTDQLFSPTRGHIVRVVAEEAGAFFRSEFRYYKLHADFRNYRRLARGWVLASRVFVGMMKPFRGIRTTPVEERFFAGGSSSVRGWERQQLGPRSIQSETGDLTPLGGNSKLEGSVELRYPTYKNLTGAVFIDFGNVWRRWNGHDPSDLRYAAGIGLRYTTPIGPLRVDSAFKLNRQDPDESVYQIHVSIGQAF